MERNEIYDTDGFATYWQVEEAKDEKMLAACEKAVEIVLAHDWHDMHYEKFALHPNARFEVEGTDFEDCTVLILNDEGEIFCRFSGKFSKESIFNDFEIELHSHPKIGELKQYSAEAYLKDKYSKK